MHNRHSPIIIHITRTPTPAPIYIASLGNLKPDDKPPSVVVELGLVEVVGLNVFRVSVTRPILGSLL